MVVIWLVVRTRLTSLTPHPDTALVREPTGQATKMPAPKTGTCTVRFLPTFRAYPAAPYNPIPARDLDSNLDSDSEFKFPDSEFRFSQLVYQGQA